jgi:hypothetical protein
MFKGCLDTRHSIRVTVLMGGGFQPRKCHKKCHNTDMRRSPRELTRPFCQGEADLMEARRRAARTRHTHSH